MPIALTPAQVIDSLTANVCVVTFTKLNGDCRIMTCTLVDEKIPIQHKASAPTKLDESLPVGKVLINAWDVNAKGWRSFYYSRITDITTTG